MSIGAVPGYVEISHFRAPYKSSYVGGLGQTASDPRNVVAESVDYLFNLLKGLSDDMRGKQPPCQDASRQIVCARRLVADRTSFWSQEVINHMTGLYRSGMADVALGARSVMDDLIYQLAYEAIPLATGYAMIGAEAEPLVRGLAATARMQAGGLVRAPVTTQFAPQNGRAGRVLARAPVSPRVMAAGPGAPLPQNGTIRPVGPAPIPQEGIMVGDPLEIEQRAFNGVTYNAYVNPEEVVRNMGNFPIVEIEDLDQQFPLGAIMLMEAGSSNPFSVWMGDMFQQGYGVVSIETAEGGVYAPTRLIDDIASLQASFGPSMVTVISEPREGWQRAGVEPADKPSKALLYGGIAAGALLLVGVIYYASS
jgi:hypothetical protein